MPRSTGAAPDRGGHEQPASKEPRRDAEEHRTARTGSGTRTGRFKGASAGCRGAPDLVTLHCLLLVPASKEPRRDAEEHAVHLLLLHGEDAVASKEPRRDAEEHLSGGERVDAEVEALQRSLGGMPRSTGPDPGPVVSRLRRLSASVRCARGSGAVREAYLIPVRECNSLIVKEHSCCERPRGVTRHRGARQRAASTVPHCCRGVGVHHTIIA